MRFTKMQGAGNDYVYVDCTKEELANPEQVAVAVSDRHFGIGADGLILIKCSQVADFFMEMYNADGSQGKMCGNGIRCVGKFVYDKGLTDKKSVTIETLSGVKTLELNVGDDGKVVSARVDMGMPELRAAKIPMDITKLANYPEQEAVNGDVINGSVNGDMINGSVNGDMINGPVNGDVINGSINGDVINGSINGDVINEPVIGAPIEVGGDVYAVTCVSMGNPHAVVYVNKDADIKHLEIEKIGPLFENHPAFPERVNTEFIQVVDRHNLNMRVWERGSGETLACGTGACASLVATVLNGRCDESAVLHLLGGDLTVTWDRLTNRVYLEGPAVTVFEGEM